MSLTLIFYAYGKKATIRSAPLLLLVRIKPTALGFDSVCGKKLETAVAMILNST